MGARNVRRYPVRSSTMFKKAFPLAVDIWGYPPDLAKSGGYGMSTAREKDFLNIVENLIGYLLTFLAPNYLSNSQSYDSMNFGVSLVSEIIQNHSNL